MSATPSPTPVPPAPPIRPSLRAQGVVILVLLVVEVLLGSELARIGPPYPWSWLGAHIGLGILLFLVAGNAFGISLRHAQGFVRVAGGLTCLATLGAVLSGFAFLFGGQSNAALYGMEGLAVVALLGSVLLIVFGSNAARAVVRPPGAPS